MSTLKKSGEDLDPAAIERQKKECEARLTALAQEEHALGEEDKAVEVKAREVEEKVRALAAEEAELNRRKKLVADEAREVGNRRTDIAARRRKIEKERDAVQARMRSLGMEEQAIQEARSREQAAAEAEKAAVIQRLPPGAEKRTSPRVEVKVEVAMHTEHNFYMGISENLSEGGVFIATYDNLPIGTQMDLDISLPDKPPIHVQGTVRWVREYHKFTEDLSPGVGVQFQNLTDQDQAAIKEFLRRRAPLLYET
ncbi:MAG: TIGR02266 family protein [Myxococcales bacterium]|nr:TIGR02266 family protein [Myxococcales bacterium]